ncbi:unconventional myosin-XVIIIb [Hyla sarda]|uniref:unconventional myosin-XVIIIb n=1 Tax=Hyla sarda TaxID=327740 RepID=UPI0024C3EA57|nr:unconventional myosin-XVIIIb [Hyla sarda]
MDFITDLPPSRNNTIIWVVVDRFSKMAYFIPLPGLPSAPQLAKLHLRSSLPLSVSSGVPAVDELVRDFSAIWKQSQQSLSQASSCMVQADKSRSPPPFLSPGDMIKEEDKGPAPTSPPPLFSVIPGGFIKQLVRETEKEAKQKVKEVKEKPVKQDQPPDNLKSPGKLNNSLVQQFVFKDENILTVGEEMASTNNVFMNGLNGDKHPGKSETPEKESKRTIRLKPVKSPTKRQSTSDPKNNNKNESTVSKVNELNESKSPVPKEEDQSLPAVEENIQIQNTANIETENQCEQEQSSKDEPELQTMPEEEKTQKEAHNIEVPAQCTEEQHISKEKVPEDVWYETEQVWFVHKDGFKLATELKPDVGTPELSDGKVRIRFDAEDKILDVDEENIHRTNPSKFDYAEDLTTLISLNESSFIHTLWQRYQSQLIHTNAGPNLIVMKPSGPVASFSTKVFKGKKDAMPPHICAVAQKAYWNMLTQRQDQTIVPLGRSSAGKTTCCQTALEYLVEAAGSVDNRVTVEKIHAMFTILKSFGGVSTSECNNSTRFSMVMSLDFNSAGRVTAGHLQTMLLERIRVAQQPEGEGNFNVFSQLLTGADLGLRSQLNLHQMADCHSFGIMPCAKPEEKQKASAGFEQLQSAMEVLGFTVNEQKAIWHVLAGIYHLGAAGACKVGRKQFMRFEWANKAASVLGCDCEELSTAVFKHHLKQIIEQVTQGTRGGNQEEDAKSGPKMSGVECVEGMAAGLYEELFAAVVSLINRSLCSSLLTLASIMVVDTPGFHNPRHQKKERAGTFEEMCNNYIQERLQCLSYKRTFSIPLERFNAENVEVSFEMPADSPFNTVSVIDQTSSQINVQASNQMEEKKGLLWILDEEVLIQGSTDDNVVNRLSSYYEIKGEDRQDYSPLRKCEQPLQFEILHQLGKDPVRYEASNWINKAKLNLSAENAVQVLQQSKIDYLKDLFMPRAKFPLICRSIAGMEGKSQQAMQRVSCIRKTFASSFAAVKRKSVCAQIKLQMDALMNLLKRSQIHFVHCLVPRLGMDGTECKSSQLCRGTAGDPINAAIDVPTVRIQLAGAQLLDAMRLCRIGYTDRMGLTEFRLRFQVLASQVMKKYMSTYEPVDERKAVEELFQLLDLEKRSIVMGRSQVFMKSGVLSRLEKQREKMISQSMILFQAACRGFLCRQKFKKIKIQMVALKCIQKNLRKYYSIRDWLWWQLMCQIRPSLSIHADESHLREKEEEIIAISTKLCKSEKSRNEMRQNVDLLESKELRCMWIRWTCVADDSDRARELGCWWSSPEPAAKQDGLAAAGDTQITDLMTELSDERFKGEVACQVLEGERSERLRVTREIKEMQVKYEQMQKSLESVSKQLDEANQQIQLRDLGTSSLGGGADDWQVRFDCAQTEINFLRKRLAQFEERLESEKTYKKELEQKLIDLQSAYENARRAAQQANRKCKHLTSDLEDTRVLMENQQIRNHELEKRQRKFDMQLAQAIGEAAFEKSLREKVTQENTSCRWEVGKLRQQLEQKELETSNLTKQLEVLKTQIKDLSSSSGLDSNSVISLKNKVWELESSVAEQNQQLVEQANSIQRLDQMRVRFEMEIERMKQMQLKELEDKEEELEDIRQSCQRRLRQFEMQLEQEYEEKQMVLHEKQDLEGLIGTLCEQIGHRDFDVEKRLRRDLKRTHALLADLQLLLASMGDSGPPVDRGELERVHLQLEESEARYAESLKSQRSLSSELESLHMELDNITRNKNMADEQLFQLQHEKAELLRRIDEDQEDLNELMKKHKALIAQSATDITHIRELQTKLEDTVKVKQSLQEKLQAALSRIDYLEQSMVERSIVSRQEAVICDLENKVEFQRAQIKRFEMLILRLRDSVIKMGEELEKAADSEAREKENAKYYHIRMEEMKAEMNELMQREMEACRRRVELETQVFELTAVRQTLQADLETSIRRIADLQAALEEVESSDDSDTERDNESTIGSVMSLGKTESQSRVGSSASWASPTGSSVCGRQSSQSTSNTLSSHSLRQQDKKDEGVYRPSSSLSSGSNLYGKNALSPDKENTSPVLNTGNITPTLARRRPSPVEEKPSRSSSALSEFLDEVRKKRASEKDQSSLVMEDASSLPIYRTTGASSLRRCTRLNDDEEDFSIALNKLSDEKPSPSQGLTRSSSLRCLPSEKTDPTLSPAVKRMARFGSCESLNQPPHNVDFKQTSSELKVDGATSLRLRPWRQCLETPLEEVGESEFGKEPLVFQNRSFSNLSDLGNDERSSSWKVPSLSFERKLTDDSDDILPALRRSQSTQSLSKTSRDRRDVQRPLSVHFGDLPSHEPSVSTGGLKSVLKKSSSIAEDLGNMSDSSSSSGSVASCKSADSIKSRPRVQRVDGEGYSGKLMKSEISQENKRPEAEGKEDDVNSIMRKYLRKIDEEQGPTN